MRQYMDVLNIHEAIERLERHLLTYEPEKYVVGQITTVRELYEDRVALKTFVGTEQIISHIARIIVGAIRDKRRMRTLDCLRVLRSLVKSGRSTNLEPETIGDLFRIYQEFIFRDNEDVQWCVSAILKDKALSDDAVVWLVQNAGKSKHIVNRLLLYPEPHPEIRTWAQRIHQEDDLSRRRSELIALLLSPDNADHLALDSDVNTFVWAVFKSRLPREQKIRLVENHSTFEAFSSVVEVADRLESPDLLRKFLKKIKNEERTNRSVDSDTSERRTGQTRT